QVLWVIDPLDGTVNYLYGLHDWAVSIAAEIEWTDGGEGGELGGEGGGVGGERGGEVGGVEGGEVGRKIVAGAVYVPMRRELFCAVIGQGAWLQAGEDYWTPRECRPGVPLDQALVGTGFGYRKERREVQG